MAVSKKVQASIEKASWIRKMFEEGARRIEKYGAEYVFDFSLGNPNIEPPDKFKQILIELARAQAPSQHAYMPNAGFPATRKAVAAYLNGFNNASFSADEIIMTVGAGGALNVVLKTILNPEEEVIIPAPYFVEYNFYLDNHQGVPRIVGTNDDFSLNIGAMEEAINKKTRAVLIDSPNNPTGKVYSETELKDLSELLQVSGKKFGRAIYLISDEPYRKIAYGGIKMIGRFRKSM